MKTIILGIQSRFKGWLGSKGDLDAKVRYIEQNLKLRLSDIARFEVHGARELFVFYRTGYTIFYKSVQGTPEQIQALVRWSHEINPEIRVTRSFKVARSEEPRELEERIRDL